MPLLLTLRPPPLQTMIRRHFSSKLRQYTQRVALPQLNQGSTLNVRSRDLPITTLLIQSGWRDDGYVEFRQTFDTSNNNSNEQYTMRISTGNDKVASENTLAGRDDINVTIEFDKDVSRDNVTTTTANSTTKSDDSTIAFSTSKKPVDKVILDDGTIHANPPESVAQDLRRIDYHDGIAHLTSDNDDSSNSIGTFVTIHVPEKINLNCNLQAGGTINIVNKIEGSVDMQTESRSGEIFNNKINVQKLRGHNVRLRAQGEIVATSLLEAQKLDVYTRSRFRGKQLHGSNVNVEVEMENRNYLGETMDNTDDEGSIIDISSMYVSGQGGAVLTVNNIDNIAFQRRAVRVKSVHGPIQVQVDKGRQPAEVDPYTQRTYPLVELGGVNGSCEVQTTNTKLLDSQGDDSDMPDSWTSCLLHIDSLSPETISLATIDSGDISLTLDRKVEADLRLFTSSTIDCINTTSALLAEEEDDQKVLEELDELSSNYRSCTAPQGAVNIHTESFVVKSKPLVKDNMHYVYGWVDNKSHEPDSRFDRKVKGDSVGSSVGKIRIEGAAEQALHGFSTSTEKEKGNVMRPLLALNTTGNISVETVSWIGAIARRYGLEDDHKGLGRTASRKGRSLLPTE